MDVWVIWLIIAVVLGRRRDLHPDRRTRAARRRRVDHVGDRRRSGCRCRCSSLVFAVASARRPAGVVRPIAHAPPARAAHRALRGRRAGRSAGVRRPRGDRADRHGSASAGRSGPPAPSTTSVVIPAGATVPTSCRSTAPPPSSIPRSDHGSLNRCSDRRRWSSRCSRSSPSCGRCASCRRPAPATSNGSAGTSARCSPG